MKQTIATGILVLGSLALLFGIGCSLRQPTAPRLVHTTPTSTAILSATRTLTPAITHTLTFTQTPTGTVTPPTVTPTATNSLTPTVTATVCTSGIFQWTPSFSGYPNDVKAIGLKIFSGYSGTPTAGMVYFDRFQVILPPSPTPTRTLTVTNTSTPTTTATPTACTPVLSPLYSYEGSTQCWFAQVGGGLVGALTTLASTDVAHDGTHSFGSLVPFAAPGTSQAFEIRFSTGVNISGKTLSVWVYESTEAIPTVAGQTNMGLVQMYVQSGVSSTWEQSPNSSSEQLPNVWKQYTWTPTFTRGDANDVRVIGLKISCGYTGTPATGMVYFDQFQVTP